MTSEEISSLFCGTLPNSAFFVSVRILRVSFVVRHLLRPHCCRCPGRRREMAHGDPVCSALRLFQELLGRSGFRLSGVWGLGIGTDGESSFVCLTPGCLGSGERSSKDGKGLRLLRRSGLLCS